MQILTKHVAVAPGNTTTTPGMSHAKTHNGSATMVYRRGDGVYTTHGSDISRNAGVKILTAKFSALNRVWTVLSVFAPSIVCGHLYYVVLAVDEKKLCAFTMVCNFAANHSDIVANAEGQVATTGLIPLKCSDNIALDPSSACYDETINRLFIEGSAFGTKKVVYADLVYATLADAIVGTVDSTDVEISEILYAFGTNGQRRVVFGSSSGGILTIRGANGFPLMSIAGKATSAYGVSTDANDDLEVIIVDDNGSLSPMNIGESVPGDIQAVILTSDGNLTVVAEVAWIPVCTTYSLTALSPTCYVYGATACNTYNFTSGAPVGDPADPPAVAPFSAVATSDGGHCTAVYDGTDVRFAFYDVDGNATVDLPMTTAILGDNAQNKLVRHGKNLSYGHIVVSGGVTASIGTIGTIVIQSAELQLVHDVATKGVALSNLPGYPYVSEAYAGVALSHVVAVDDLVGFICWRRVASQSAEPAYEIVELAVVGDEFFVKTLVGYSECVPGHADYLDYAGDRYLALQGNPVTGDNNSVVIMKLTDYIPGTTIIPTVVHEFELDGVVESLRGEGASLAYTVEDLLVNASFEDIAYTAVALQSNDSPASSIFVEALSDAVLLDLVLDGFWVLNEYGRYRVYAKFTHSGGAPATIAFNGVDITFAAGEVAHVHLGDMTKNVVSYNAGDLDLVPERLQTIAAACSLGPSNTVEDLFVDILAVINGGTAYQISAWRKVGYPVQGASTIGLYDLGADNLVEVATTEEIKCIAVVSGVPSIALVSAKALL